MSARYGHAHQVRRVRLAPLVATGTARCARCGLVIGRGEAWDLGHDDLDPMHYAGPEHRRCNRATAAHRRSTAPQPVSYPLARVSE